MKTRDAESVLVIEVSGFIGGHLVCRLTAVVREPDLPDRSAAGAHRIGRGEENRAKEVGDE